MKKFNKYNLDYPIGCIIAKVNLIDCIEITDKERKMLKEKNKLVYSNVINNKKWKGYGFELSDVEKIKPIYINGKLSLWEYNYK